ncbi:MAG: anthranilate synthase component I [Nitrospirales bacterium]|nr:anthranilate synthase component I [Nitrospirales bacterium]
MNTGGYTPDFKEFCALAKQGNLIPVSREVLADFETPVSALAKIDRGSCAYLLESVEGGDKWARYSFLGSGSPTLIHGNDREVIVSSGRHRRRIPVKTDLLACLREIMLEYRPVQVPGLPRFCGGAVGYLSYDVVRQFERLPAQRKDILGLPQACFLLTDTLLIFDNVAQTIRVVANAHVGTRNHKAAYADAVRRIDRMIARLRTGRRPAPRRPASRRPPTFTSNMSKADFEKVVMQTKEYIKAGDIFQGVLSQRWQASIRARPFDIYRALRVINPSPYMYYLRFPEVELVGASPEVLVRCEDGLVQLRPIAGTRRRGATEEEDRVLREELLANEKERAEHVMLVDLGRNDVGRVARPGTVRVKDFMAVEQYSHVMHLVSQVEGRLQQGMDSYDVLRACFPAGTVSGAPKIRAMEIIEELEPSRRGPYAGAVGYFGFSGNMDTCINIRTVVVKGRQAFIQAGAGIVADSDPEAEYVETCNKAKAMMRAVEMAEKGLD